VWLVEKRTLASGASGGMLGALMPHHPGGWSDKKQFQLNGLLTLPDSISELERETGLHCGFGRIGRIQPIGHSEKRRQSMAWLAGASDHWPDEFDWSIRDDHPAPRWATCDAPHGWNTDTLSARIDPRALTGALSKWARTNSNIVIHEGEPCEYLSNSGPTILAAGAGSFALLDPADPLRIGRGVKGQGARFWPRTPIAPDQPIIYDSGTYVIAHADGSIAVGSTSENDYGDPNTTDHRLDSVIEHARTICPPMRDADMIERWAGIRPKAGKPDPLLGPWPDSRNIIVATGGFKITFAIAHLMAKAAVAMVLGEPTDIPLGFLPERRLTQR